MAWAVQFWVQKVFIIFISSSDILGKNDLKADVRRIETIVEDVETRVKEDARSNERELKSTVDGIEEDMNKLEKCYCVALPPLQLNTIDRSRG